MMFFNNTAPLRCSEQAEGHNARARGWDVLELYFDNLELWFCLTDPKICVFKHIVI